MTLLKKKKKPAEEIKIPITPMLDMAFQLLTFFILTYKPAPSEGQFAMTNENIPAALRTLPTVLRAAEGGALGRVSLGEQDVQGMAALKRELQVILKDPSLPFDQALIKVDPNLKYSELMQVIDVFSSLKLSKVSFAELGPNDAG
jgi:biopolymer transport protein ExbD